MSPRKKTRAIRQERQVRTGSKGGNPSRRGSSAFKKRARQVQTDMIEDPSLPFARAVTGTRKLLYIPWFEPGEVVPVPTKSKAERLLVGRWMAALNAAASGDFSKIDKFPRNTVIGGVRLPTDRKEIQQILKSLADKESPFEGLYRTIARRR